MNTAIPYRYFQATVIDGTLGKLELVNSEYVNTSIMDVSLLAGHTVSLKASPFQN